jgi:hypothetical protein
MGPRRGQSTIEFVGLALVVGALVAVGLAAARGDLGPAVALALRGLAGRDAPPAPSAAALAYLDRSLTASDDAPAVGDAILRLGGEIGPERAAALALERALRRHLPRAGARARALADPAFALARPDLDGAGPPTADVWSDRAPRAAPSARIVDAAAERAWRASLVPAHPQRIADAAASGAAAAFGALNPAAAAAVLAIGAITAAGADLPRGAPPGSRDGDLVLCAPVWRINRATPIWADGHPHETLRLRLGERVAAVELTVVRAGTVIQRAVVRSDATRC